MDFWRNRRVIVTGGAGFLGRHIVSNLKAQGCESIATPRRLRYDLTRQEGAAQMFRDFPCDIVIHAAGDVGGIGKNRREPGTIFYNNLLIGTHVIEEARKAFVEKLVYIGSVCSYPEFVLAPFKEDDLWRGQPEETNRYYGLSKKAHLTMLEAYAKEFGFSSAYLLLANLYGPGDDFVTDDAHVIPAMIRKLDTEEDVTLWGSGMPTRDFLYVEDAAEAVVRAARLADEIGPFNIAAGRPISMKDLAATIATMVGHRGEIKWDFSRPDGVNHRELDATRASQEFGWQALTPLSAGLEKTVAAYLAQKDARDKKGKPKQPEPTED